MGCSAWFVQNIVSEYQAKELYSKGNSAKRWARNSFKLQKPDIILKVLERLLGTNKKILDIGCNTGELLDFAKSLGGQTFGVELSSVSREILIQKGHASYKAIDEINERFDVITAFDIVEHLYQIPEFFRKCNSLLKDEGRLVILTGNITSISARICKENWWYVQYPEHIVFPSIGFYKQTPGFCLDGWYKTYVSVSYQHSLVQLLRTGITTLLGRDYNGLPSLGPDHALIVLKKCAVA